MTGCELCLSSSQCSSCYSGYYLQNSSCLLCNTGVGNCAVCLNSTVCSICYPDSSLKADGSECICNGGLVKTSKLCAVTGCASAYRFDSTSTCLACNTSQNFEFDGISCNCALGYQVSGDTCELICGDGRVITEACDDGNVLNGDGCSSVCTLETDFTCLAGSIYKRSLCTYTSPISVSLLSVKRAIDANTATVTLKLQPNVRPLASMDFSQYVSLTVGNHSLSYSVSYTDDGTLTFTVAFSSNIEGQSAIISLAYDSSRVTLPPTELSFRMVGHNNPLNYAEPADLQWVILYLGYIIDGLFLLQLVVSLIFHKMIGLETMQIAQTIFFVRYLLQDDGSMAVYNLRSLSLINGYNLFSSYTNVMDLDAVSMRLGLGKNFLFNVMIQIAVILLAWLARLICSRKINRLR
jgi:cysteine-rich repeat protein